MVHESSSETLSKRIRILKKLQQKNIYTKKQCKIITDTETKEIGSSISHSFKQYDDYYKESISGMCDKYTSGNQKSKETIDAELQALKNTEAQLGNNIRTSQANILKMKEECELRKDENYHLQKEMDFKEEQARRALAVINEIEQIRAEMRGLCQKTGQTKTTKLGRWLFIDLMGPIVNADLVRLPMNVSSSRSNSASRNPLLKTASNIPVLKMTPLRSTSVSRTPVLQTTSNIPDSKTTPLRRNNDSFASSETINKVPLLIKTGLSGSENNLSRNITMTRRKIVASPKMTPSRSDDNLLIKKTLKKPAIKAMPMNKRFEVYESSEAVPTNSITSEEQQCKTERLAMAMEELIAFKKTDHTPTQKNALCKKIYFTAIDKTNRMRRVQYFQAQLAQMEKDEIANHEQINVIRGSIAGINDQIVVNNRNLLGVNECAEKIRGMHEELNTFKEITITSQQKEIEFINTQIESVQNLETSEIAFSLINKCDHFKNHTTNLSVNKAKAELKLDTVLSKLSALGPIKF